jgi:hypothetical protein
MARFDRLLQPMVQFSIFINVSPLGFFSSLRGLR